MSDDRLKRFEIAPGTVADFRALMGRLSVRYAAGWLAPTSEILGFSMLPGAFPSYCCWHVYVIWEPAWRASRTHSAPREKRSAGIEVVEENHGQTRVTFVDGYYPLDPGRDREPIGPAFEEFRDMIVREMQSPTPAWEDTGEWETVELDEEFRDMIHEQMELLMTAEESTGDEEPTERPDRTQRRGRMQKDTGAASATNLRVPARILSQESAPMAFDILDALVHRCLQGDMPGWVDFVREETTRASVEYRLNHWQLGNLGAIELRKVDDRESVITVYEPPPMPLDDELTPEDREAFAAVLSQEGPEQAVSEIHIKIHEETQDLFHRRKEYQAKVLERLCHKLNLDPAWRAAKGDQRPERRKGAPPLEERADAEEKREKARKYLRKVENGVPKEIAAQLVGHCRKTLERWVKRLL